MSLGDAVIGLLIGGGIGLVLVSAMLWPMVKWHRGSAPRFTDRPASHAAAHVKGEPCACYPRPRSED